ncbi:MAG: peptidylprolyl isomerase [Nanoarchaeota archaeon]|nr:peptidylprolyl isomerase [Nanoarchaeota archaeon]
MSEKIQLHDFVEIDYTGKLADGTVFDTTSEKIAKEQHLHSPKQKYQPTVVCVGERQLLPGLDAQLVDKELGKEYTVTLPPEKAFGKRDIKQVKIIPMNMFQQHKVQPHPGLQVDVDGEMGMVSRVSGGRVIVNFNHPLAGKEVTYSYKVLRKVTDQKEKVSAFLSALLRLPAEAMKIEVKDNAATVSIPGELPTQISTTLAQKLVQLTGLKDILFKKEEMAKKEVNKEHHH